MIGHGNDEACDERIRCGRHGRRDAGASPGEDPGVVLSRISADGGGDVDDDNDDDDDDDDDDDVDEREYDDRRRCLHGRAG